MNTHRLGRAIGGLVAALLVIFLGSAQVPTLGNSDAVETDQPSGQSEFHRLAEMMSEIIDPIIETYYTAAQGCNAVTVAELNVSAQATLNMIEGANSPLFVDTPEIPFYVTGGIRPTVESFSFTDGWFDPSVTSNMQKRRLEDAYTTIRQLLSSVSELLQELLDESISYAEKKESMGLVCLSLDELEYTIEGFLRQFGYEIHLQPGDSVQEVIDGARDGAVIYFGPTTYAGPLRITKNITLDGSLTNANPLLASIRLMYGSAITTEAPGEIAVSIHGEQPIQVTIRQLTIKSVTEAIALSGEATVLLEDVTIRDADTAVRVFDGGHADMSRCLFELNHLVVDVSQGGRVVGRSCTFFDNRQAILATSGSSCALADSIIELCGVPEDDASLDVGVVAADCSDLVLERCIIRDNYGAGVALGGGDSSTLHMMECQITNNGLGLHLDYADCNPTGDSNGHSEEHSHGTITGWANTIPGPDEPNGNRNASFWYCCETVFDPSFLSEPKPSDS